MKPRYVMKLKKKQKKLIIKKTDLENEITSHVAKKANKQKDASYGVIVSTK